MLINDVTAQLMDSLSAYLCPRVDIKHQLLVHRRKLLPPSLLLISSASLTHSVARLSLFLTVRLTHSVSYINHMLLLAEWGDGGEGALTTHPEKSLHSEAAGGRRDDKIPLHPPNTHTQTHEEGFINSLFISVFSLLRDKSKVTGFSQGWLLTGGIWSSCCLELKAVMEVASQGIFFLSFCDVTLKPSGRENQLFSPVGYRWAQQVKQRNKHGADGWSKTSTEVFEDQHQKLVKEKTGRSL